MKIAYLDCASGISGDMMLGALVDVGAPLEALQDGIDSLGLPSCRLEIEEVKRKGFRGTKVHVRHEPEHAHRHLHHIQEMIDRSRLNPRQQDIATRIFARLAEAEAHVHGTTIRKVHFHEVGAVDSIADIVGTAIGWDLLAVDTCVCSPIPTGSGTIEIAHGRTSVPAPATAELLKGIPLADSVVTSELTTPTGAAIVGTLAQRFGPVPAMTVEKIGCGAGDRDFAEQSNLLRLLLGEEHSALADQICVLETNLDDTNGEWIGHCCEQLMAAGALDVYWLPIAMKKNRPGVLLTVLCEVGQRDRFESILFRETTSLGVRSTVATRRKLPRESRSVQTPWGSVPGKVVCVSGSERFSPEYEACRGIATAHQVPIPEVYQAARDAFVSRARD